MCDTFVALGNATIDGSVIFGKNSDREPNEAHQLVMFPRMKHDEGEQAVCTYIEISQVAETNAVLLSKPFWIWGAEMGANEHGVVIGNEAVFTKEPYEKKPGLIGMDFLRLALERASSADEALDVIIDLLEVYGQGGNCGFAKKFFYHNSFLIADPDTAWVLDTAGKHWAAEKVQDVRAISNVISISSHWDRASENLVSHAIEKGWCKSKEEFNFSRCYSDLVYTKFSDGEHRSCRTTDLLKEKIGEIDVSYAMQILKDHGPDADNLWNPGKGITGAEVCMHASFGPIRGSQTTGSMVSHLTGVQNTHWLTGTAAPCTSLFKPVWMDAKLPDLSPEPTGIYDQASLWWRHENLHREILRDYATRIKPVREDTDKLQNEFVIKAAKVADEPRETRTAMTVDCFHQAATLTDQLEALVKKLSIENRRPLMHKAAWKKFDREAERS